MEVQEDADETTGTATEEAVREVGIGTAEATGTTVETEVTGMIEAIGMIGEIGMTGTTGAIGTTVNARVRKATANPASARATTKTVSRPKCPRPSPRRSGALATRKV